MTAPDAETALNTILEGIGQPFYAVDGEWRITHFNGEAARHFGRSPGEMIGHRLWDIYPEDMHSERARALFEVMEQRRAIHGEGHSMVERRWISYRIFPLGTGIGVVFRDITEHREAKQDRDHALNELRQRTVELEAVLETIPTAVWFTYDRDAGQIIGNRRASELLQMPRGAHRSLGALGSEGRPSYRFWRDGVEVRSQDLPLQRAARGEEVRDELLELQLGNGERKTLLLRAAPLLNEIGHIVGAVCAGADVTERLRYEDHLKLLLNELNHRVKNTLAIVQSIAALTLKGTDAPARADFERRLLTLSAVHGLLTDENWDGVQIHALVRASLKAHFDSDRERVRYEGEDFRLRPKSAVALSIALNELGTNAVKYGALSASGGSVSVSWILGADRFRLRWEETGGPPVTPPGRTGFGTRMIERGLAAELRGDARIDYRPQGLVCTLDAPLAAIRESSADKGLPT
jgi:PAS domain S-box-containing protein